MEKCGFKDTRENNWFSLILKSREGLISLSVLWKNQKTNIQMERNERPIYESPAVEVVLLQPDSAILQTSSAGASTQSLNEEDYEW